jgi:hypothetical protein
MPTAFDTLIKSFFSLCLLRTRPQDLPSSRFLLNLSLSVYTLLSTLLALIDLPMSLAVMVGFLNTALLVGFVLLILKVRGFMSRSTQTLTALAGAGALLTVIAFPILLWMQGSDDQPSSVGLPKMLWLLMLAWDLMVVAHVLRHALAVHFGVGFVLAFVYVWMAPDIIRIVIGPLG